MQNNNKPRFGASTFIGETITGLPAPIFFDPHYPIIQNKPPVTLITGSPGSGKTFTAEILAGHSSVLNKLTYVIDPKGDFIALDSLAKKGYINKTTVWSIFRNDDKADVNNENYGMLDPFYLTKNRKDNLPIVKDTIVSLVGGISDKQSNMLIPIIKDVSELREPSLSIVVKELRSNPDNEIRNLGNKLGLILDTSVAKLITAKKRRTDNPFSNSDGLMIVSLLGLNLPESETKEADYSDEERLATVIMQLLTQLVLEAMKSQPIKVQKTLFVDEAWVVFGSAAGRKLINTVALLGRSRNLATILATQSPRHLSSGTGEEASGGSTLDTSISTRFAFRNDSDIDNSINRRAMRLPENDGWEGIFTQLKTGQCMLRDCDGNLAIMRTMTSTEWQEAFDTNPNASVK